MSAYSTYSDEQLLALLKSSDEQAFNQLYHRYWRRLFYTAGTKLNDAFLAKEIVQDIFADLWERRQTIHINYLFKTYIATALKYQVITHQAKRKKAAINIDTSETKLVIADDTTQQLLDFEELKDRLEKYIGELPEKCQLIFRMSRQQGISHKQIANKLDISERTVESQVFKALNKLRHNLGHFLFSILFM